MLKRSHLTMLLPIFKNVINFYLLVDLIQVLFNVILLAKDHIHIIVLYTLWGTFSI
jgi:hypothetical protein